MQRPMYQTRLQTIHIPNTHSLLIRTLMDRQQYWDPKGDAARQGIGSALWSFFGVLWPSSIYLADHMAARPVQAGERILEIGCGLALPSLVCHRQGADITASDRHPLAPRFLRKNLHLNDLPITLPYRHGGWGETPSNDEPPLTGRYDMIIGSDLLYDRDAPQALASFIARHAYSHSQVWIVDANRGHHATFTRQLAEHGFVHVGQICLNRDPCLSGVRRYRGRLLKYHRME